MRAIHQLSVLIVAGGISAGLSIGCAAAMPTAPGKPHTAAHGTGAGGGRVATADRHSAATTIGTGNFRIDSDTGEVDVVDPAGAILVRVPLNYAPRTIPSAAPRS